eukprot:CAMPEP_0204826200 /NCGR_PEP_ID=MMETSP1346-20131115/3928_1 /ASSEMBLY_ACC=CAM_ASM_000771 /TAXON_ID=215587 /ORGANISM="Aplanochytrium stocchinoi, Strain GSBS06" /LENGTH=46 /DNA_ID= /DNA_START= /DNA_END= /DNA_ORIENTATION=
MAAPLWEILPKVITSEVVEWWNREFEEVLIPPVEIDAKTKRLRLAP